MFLMTPPLNIRLEGGWITLGELKYLTDMGEVITVPTGFCSDLASIPVGFRNIINQNGRHRRAAILHDYLYSKRGKITIDKGWVSDITVEFSRKEQDQIFLEAMKIDGVGFFTRRAMYSAVRMFGWTHYK